MRCFSFWPHLATNSSSSLDLIVCELRAWWTKANPQDFYNFSELACSLLGVAKTVAISPVAI